MTDVFTMLVVIIPIAIGIIGAMWLYFGRIISKFYVSKTERIDVYMYGLFFSLFFIVAPFLIYISTRLYFTVNPDRLLIWMVFLKNMILDYNNILTVILLIPFIPVFIISYATVKIWKENLSYYEYHQRRIFFFSRCRSSPHYLERSLKYILFNKTILFILLYIFAFIIILPPLIYLDAIILFPIDINSITMLSEPRIIYFLSSLFYWIGLISCIAITYGYTYVRYPLYTIYYKIEGNANLVIRRGKIISSSDKFVFIKSRNRIHEINVDKIVEIQRRL